MNKRIIKLIATLGLFIFVGCGSDDYDHIGYDATIPPPSPLPSPAEPPIPRHLLQLPWFERNTPEDLELDLEIDRSSVVSASVNRSMAIDADGMLWAWGNNSLGRLGDGTGYNRLYPVVVMEGAAAVTVTEFVAHAIDERGRLLAWGTFNPYERLVSVMGAMDAYGNIPGRIARMDNIAMFDSHNELIAAITLTGDLYIWGNGHVNPLYMGGHDVDLPDLSRAVLRVRYGRPASPTLRGVRQVSVGYNVVAAINLEGQLYMWGTGNRVFFEELFERVMGTVYRHQILRPMRVMEGVSDVSIGYEHILVLTENGRVYALGRGRDGQIGNGDNADAPSPVFVMDNVVQISAGHSHSAAITSNGVLYTWGNNQMGRLGDGTITGRNTPVAVLNDVNAVSAGDAHTLAVTNDGRLFAWGDNRQGQLGDGTTESRFEPVLIMENMKLVP